MITTADTHSERVLKHALLLGLAVVVFLTVLFPLTNTDIWWHLAAGKLMLERGEFFRVDPFSLSAAGRPWIDVHWLFQLLAIGAFRLGGVLAIVLAKCALCAAAAIVLLRAVESSTARTVSSRAVAVIFIAAFTYAAWFLLLARPIVLTLLYLSIQLYALERFRSSGRSRVLLLVLAAQLLWSNTQGLFALGPALVACYLFGELLSVGLQRFGFDGFEAPASKRQLLALAATLLGVIVACLITPYGIDGLKLPLTLFMRIDPVGQDLFSYNISENVPPLLLERSGDVRVAAFKWVAASAFATFLLRHRNIVLGRFALLGAMFALALMANRNILLFCWVAAMVAAINVSAWLGRKEAAAEGGGPAERRSVTAWLADRQQRVRFVPRPWALAVAAAVLLATVGALRARTLLEDAPLDEPAPFRLPEQAITRLQQLGLGGNIFNSIRYGGYLAWKTYPQHRPFIDGRLVIRPPSHFAQHLRLLDNPETFEAFRREQDIRIALLPTTLPERYLPLVAELYRDPDWQLLYTDGTQTLFAHHSATGKHHAEGLDLGSRATIARIVAALDLRHPPNNPIGARARTHLGRLLAEVGERQRAVEQLQHRSGLVRQDHRRDTLLARVHYLDGRPQQARALSHALLARDDKDVDSLTLLALLDADAKRYQQATRWATRALDINPHHHTAQVILQRIRRETAVEKRK